MRAECKARYLECLASYEKILPDKDVEILEQKNLYTTIFMSNCLDAALLVRMLAIIRLVCFLRALFDEDDCQFALGNNPNFRQCYIRLMNKTTDGQ